MSLGTENNNIKKNKNSNNKNKKNLATSKQNQETWWDKRNIKTKK